MIVLCDQLVNMIFDPQSVYWTANDVAKIALSNHYLVYICIDLKVKSREHKTIRYRDFKDFNVENCIADLDISNILSKAIFNDNNTI